MGTCESYPVDLTILMAQIYICSLGYLTLVGRVGARGCLGSGRLIFGERCGGRVIGFLGLGSERLIFKVGGVLEKLGVLGSKDLTTDNLSCRDQGVRVFDFGHVVGWVFGSRRKINCLGFLVSGFGQLTLLGSAAGVVFSDWVMGLGVKWSDSLGRFGNKCSDFLMGSGIKYFLTLWWREKNYDKLPF